MTTDIIRDHGYLTLGSRLKRLGERLQADVGRLVEHAGLPIQPAHYPLLAAIDRAGPISVNDLADAVGISQPGATRSLARLVELGLVESSRTGHDQRQRMIALTPAGHAAMARSKRELWPHIDAAVAELCAGRSGPLLAQLAALEDGLARIPLDRRACQGTTARLSIRGYDDALARHFHDINRQWIETMFAMEDADRAVLEQPRTHIIDPGGDILFVEAEGIGIVGTCALRKAGDGQFELTKMGVLESARGLKAGEFLLRAMVRRAGELGADPLYLLTNRDCASAIHLYEKVGFVHDAGIMRDFGARYERCNVAMRYVAEAVR